MVVGCVGGHCLEVWPNVLYRTALQDNNGRRSCWARRDCTGRPEPQRHCVRLPASVAR